MTTPQSLTPTTRAQTALRAVLYARVSTTHQSADMQVEALRAEAARRGWQVVAECVDEGWSGRKDRRPQLDRAMELIRSGQADVLAVWKFDRFARSVRHLLRVLDELRERNVRFLSLTEAIETDSAFGRAIFTIISAIGELEADLCRERVTTSVRSAIARGQRWGRPRRTTDETVAKACELRAAGRSWRQVAMAIGVPSRTIRRAVAEAKDAGAKTPPVQVAENEPKSASASDPTGAG